MGLQGIIWNGLYAAQPRERFAETRILFHFTRRRLSRRGVKKAVARYSPFTVVAPLMLTSFCRPTGWHGESGAAKAGGHIVVDFYRSNMKHVTTHHVYPTDDAYHDRLGVF
jgi:hypothetical protein